MQESRLFKIIYHLLIKGFATAPELAKELEVSTRTIYRDIDALSSAGIPIYVTTGRNGGIHLMEDFVLDKTVLSQKEKQDILTSLQNLFIANSDYAQDTLIKLSALFNLTAEDWFEIDFSRWNEKTKDNRKFNLIKNAIVNHLVVKITYANSCGDLDERKIQPLKLLFKSKDWYLKAYCMKKQDFRIFKLNRIIKYELLTESFQPVSYPKENIEEHHYNTIRLRFDKEITYRVYDEFDSSQIEQLDNGDYIVTAEMPEDPWLLGYLFSLGTQVTVLEPLSLRTSLAEHAKKIYETHKT